MSPDERPPKTGLAGAGSLSPSFDAEWSAERREALTEAALTVVVNTYERVDSLSDALRSVIGQAAPGIELVVVDDGSPHDVESVVKQTCGDTARYVRQENAGLSAARNAGWRRARGRFVLFLDDDDALLPGSLVTVLKMISDPSVGIACGAAELVEQDVRTEILRPASLGSAMEQRVGLFLAGTWAMRRDILAGVGGFDESVRTSHQHELFLRAVPFCVANGLEVVSTPKPIVKIKRASPSERIRNRPERLYVTANRMLDVHGERLRRLEPWTYSNLVTSAGVAAMKLGRPREGRRLLWRAFRVDHRNRATWLRLGVAWSPPPVRRRVWGR